MSSTMTKTDVGYHDRQYPRLLLGLGSFMVLLTGVAVGAVFGGVARVLVWIMLEVLVLVVSLRLRLDVRVDVEGVGLGRASIPWSFVDRVEVLRGDAFRAALTTDGHPTDFRRIRSTAAGIRVWLADPTDPHRAWVASVRDPRACETALGALR